MKGLTAVRIISKANKLASDRANWDSKWQEEYDYCLPRKNDVTTTNTPGQKKYNHLFDSTAMMSNELLAGTIHGILTNPAGYFFNLSSGDPKVDSNDDVRMWFQQVTRRMHEVLTNSNFHTEVHEMYLDVTSIGNSCMYAEEDPDTIIRFSTRAIREVYFEENSRGFIDTVYRKYKMDARGIIEDFGIDRVPEKVRKSFEAGKTDQFEVIHAVYPRTAAKLSKKDNRFAYISQYVLVQEKLTLEIRGYNELPYFSPRWNKASGETYGRGCAEKAIPSSKTANEMRKTVLRGAQKVVDPPLQAPDDGFVMPLITRPGGLNYYRAGSQDRIEEIFNDARIDFGFQAIDQERVQIREAFYTDQLKLREGPQMTATEVSERVQQALRFLGPMIGRQQSEFLQPLVERVYSILDRKGEIPEAPAQLQGKPLRIQYSSIMAMQQRMSEVENIQRTMQNIAVFASADPSILDNINGDEAFKYVARLFNFPQELIRKTDEVAAMREKRAQQQAEQARIVAEQMQADSASKVITAGSKNSAASKKAS
jgi:hypothetical protein